MLPVALDENIVDDLFTQVERQPGYQLKADLPAQQLIQPDGAVLKFGIEPFRKHCLVNGLDDIALTLSREEQIKEYERKRKIEAPWLFEA